MERRNREQEVAEALLIFHSGNVARGSTANPISFRQGPGASS